MFCVELYPFAKAGEFHVFLAFLICKAWLIILFIAATGVYEEFAIDFCVYDFLLLPAFSLQKDLKQYTYLF